MNQLYKRLNPDSTLEDIKTLLADVQNSLAPTPEADTGADKDNKDDPEAGTEQQPYAPEIQEVMDGLTSSVEQLSNYIDKFQMQQDKTWTQQIKDEAASTVLTYNQAYDATMFYTKGWFSRLFLSVEAKVEIAGYLLTIISPLCNANLDTLQMISNRDPDIILYISWPREDD